MSTGHMPNPPDRPTRKVPEQAADAQAQADPQAQAPAQPPFDLASDLASIIEAQADVIAQRLTYHNQMLFGVSAQAVDVVNARNSTLIVANALRNKADKQMISTLVDLGTAQRPQINDATLPFRHNGLTAGLLEGILLDVASMAYRDNPDRTKEARLLLNGYFQAANERIENPSRALAAPAQ
ncbi:MAG TPA: hypothetical protein VLQ48_05680 [Chloroflexia bacterium]|nr:hypothetical protein [Chloroflexia bacterium]